MGYDVAGKSIKELQRLRLSELTKMPKSDVRAITQRLASAANKRKARMEKAGVVTPAITKLEETGGKISTKGKGKEELIKEFARARDYLQNPHSSLKIHKLINKRLKAKMEKEGLNPSEEEVNDINNIMHGLEKEYPELKTNTELRYEIIKQVYEYLDNQISPSDIIEAMKDKLEQIYIEQQEMAEAFEQSASPWF